jgi:hypothetical protein
MRVAVIFVEIAGIASVSSGRLGILSSIKHYKNQLGRRDVIAMAFLHTSGHFTSTASDH